MFIFYSMLKALLIKKGLLPVGNLQNMLKAASSSQERG